MHHIRQQKEWNNKKKNEISFDLTDNEKMAIK